ncbi:MAG TPA: universal stress protein [Streptosporangiaceae bacterium]|nr:universal stress protein [Streptosporangiaceae bacterium]
MSAAKPFRRVLVGWDGSRDASAALRAAAAIVGDDEGHVVALAVLPPVWHAETAHERSVNEIAARDRVQAPFERLNIELAVTCGARINLQFDQNRHIPDTLCRYATEHGFDLLALGRHGDGGGIAGRLGHVADAVVRTAGVPLLLVSVP